MDSLQKFSKDETQLENRLSAKMYKGRSLYRSAPKVVLTGSTTELILSGVKLSVIGTGTRLREFCQCIYKSVNKKRFEVFDILFRRFNETRRLDRDT